MLTMLRLKCQSCDEKFIIHNKEYKRNFKNIKKPKNLNKVFLENVKKALKHPELTRLAYTKIFYEKERYH